ncbi:protein DpdJ [Streptomyces sp. NPDC048279]|uniref:protein DpdJ n=1 Tax=Streptomyces sp. NPDC048279 TaxID=3154714 RepID=UPI00343A3627
MTQLINQGFANALLNRLEDRELPLLSWGVTESALSEAEVLETIDELLVTRQDAPPGASTDEVLEDCLDRALLFEVPVPVVSPPRYRTRLAETLRLTAGLRQLFARGGWASQPDRGWWRQQKRLVADYRLHVAPRRYPRRDIPAEDALAELARLDQWRDLQQHVAAAHVRDYKLARFQLDATRTVFKALGGPRSTGIIVGAGTGSGKTLAFYLPAFAAMAEHARPGTTSRVHTLALYPRLELLRDQLREAIRGADGIEGALRAQGRRALRIGALYGNTPWNARDLKLEPGGRVAGAWARTPEGAICPYLPCPNLECGTGDLVWSDSDRLQGREQLTCVKCGHTIKDGRLALTRESLKANEPDLLFTTTETLNRASADSYLERLLGWRGGNPGPALVLLDEVHTYTGVHGAQVALLLRRWREAVGRPVTFVGLSATLRDARHFFAQLVGLHPGDVEPIEPAEDAMETEGREYALALRGDPVAGASLLSTSIQTAMLFGRTLDQESDRFLYGSTGFLFTDDLDVTNRFYDDLRDAEGGQYRSGGRSGWKPVLAGLRSPDRDEHDARYRDGQSWDMVEKIGHDLDPGLRLHHLRIGRTSSQDVGVDHNADLTVATASLEVGFNDPRVGLVLQHKAPRDAAAFIQRRGRAGRQRGTRPITVVTLSDYGRDRLAYQAYETLFAPEVPARTLPIGNRFVLKIQGTQALLDWAGRKLRSRRQWADPRKLLKAPRGGVVRQEDQAASEMLAELLQALLDNSGLQDELANHLVRALRISADEAQALLWEQPRSLLLAVVPTALRRLRSQWRPLRDDSGARDGAMLPEFVTQSLFAPLNLPEVDLLLPFSEGDSIEQLPIARALREAVPGRVSRRYGHRRDEHRTWLPMPPDDTDALPLTDIVRSGDPEGMWFPHGHGPSGFQVFRPQQLILDQPPQEIDTRSQGIPRWGTQIVVPEDASLSSADVPEPSLWSQRIASVNFATHAAGNPIEVRRMTMGADCEIARKRGDSEKRTVRYEVQGQPAALGFRLEVDAFRVRLMPLDLAEPAVRDYLDSPQWRSLAFSHAVAEDPTLAEITNKFQREWLTQVYLTAFALAGLDGTRTGEQVRASLADGSWSQNLAEIFKVLYRDNSESEQPVDGDRLVAALLELSHDSRVISALDRAAELLVAPDVAAHTEELAQRAYRDTLAAAISTAAQRACHDAQDGDLIVDVLPGDGLGDPATVWLSETSIGGLGVIERLVQYYSEDPRRFWGLVASALAPSDYEYVDATLTRLLRHLIQEPGGEAAQMMNALRGAEDSTAAGTALRGLRAAWERLDGPPRRTAVSAMSTRLLRPGSSPDTDAVALGLVDAWSELEQRLGIEVDARVLAYAAGAGRLTVSRSREVTADQAFSLLWPRGRQARTQDLQHYQPYVGPPALDRLLVQAAHDDDIAQIDVTGTDWTLTYQKAMSEGAAVQLVCPARESTAMAQALVRVPALPIDRDFLKVFGEVRGFGRHRDQLQVRVELREAAQ